MKPGKGKFETRRDKGTESKTRPYRDAGKHRFRNDDAQTNREPRTRSVIFGLLPVVEALRANPRKIERILIAEGGHEHRLQEVFDLAKENRVPFQKTPRQNLLRFLEPDTNHQGVLAFVAAADYMDADVLLDEIKAKKNSLSVVLDGVEDPRNLGAILRTAECAGADGVFIPERRAVGLTETVAKSAAGATEYVKVAKVGNLNRLIEELKENNIWVVGTSSEAEIDYTEWDWTRNAALVMGGEGKGLHRLTAEKCDVLVRIPLLGKIESLNVSVATGVVLYEAIRQRKAKEEEQRTK